MFSASVTGFVILTIMVVGITINWARWLHKAARYLPSRFTFRSLRITVAYCVFALVMGVVMIVVATLPNGIPSEARAVLLLIMAGYGSITFYEDRAQRAFLRLHPSYVRQ